MKPDMTKAKELHRQTGAYVTACQQALELCEFDMELAYEYLRLKSQAVSRYKIDNSGNKVPYETEDYLELARTHLKMEGNK